MKRFVFDFTSDLHVDIWEDAAGRRLKHPNWETVKSSDAMMLIVAGDIANTPQDTVEALQVACKHYQQVAFVDGNHDHYNSGKTVDETVDFYKSLSAQGTMSVGFLTPDNPMMLTDSVALLGCNGWYDWNYPGAVKEIQPKVWHEYMNDRRCIKWGGVLPDVRAAREAAALASTVRELSESDWCKRIAIVTHTVPHVDGVVARLDNFIWQALNGSYYNSHMKKVRDADVNDKIAWWGFGHTHKHQRYSVADAGLWYQSRPRGYPGELPHWAPARIFI